MDDVDGKVIPDASTSRNVYIGYCTKDDVMKGFAMVTPSDLAERVASLNVIVSLVNAIQSQFDTLYIESTKEAIDFYEKIGFKKERSSGNFTKMVWHASDTNQAPRKRAKLKE